MGGGTATGINFGVRIIPNNNEWYDMRNSETEDNPVELDATKRYDLISVGEGGVAKILGLSRDDVYRRTIVERIEDPLSEIFVRESAELRKWP